MDVSEVNLCNAWDRNAKKMLMSILDKDALNQKTKVL
jgi:hypothetical protein